MDWTAEEAALIEEFTQMLSTTPRERLLDTTRHFMEEETSYLQPTELLETARTLLSSTNRAVAQQQNSVLFNSDPSKRPNTFADLLPRESLNPPKLEQATSFEHLLKQPKIYEETESGTRRTIDLEKKRKIIKEALERIR